MSREESSGPRPAVEGPISAGGGSKSEATTRAGGVLGRIYQSLAEFTVLTDHLRQVVDERLGARLSVTGWQDGVLRIRLDQPALATRWRFQEPAVRRALARLPVFAGLKEIRVALAAANGRSMPTAARPAASSKLDRAPVEAFRELADNETHERLRKALTALAEAAAQARKGVSGNLPAA